MISAINRINWDTCFHLYSQTRAWLRYFILVCTHHHGSVFPSSASRRYGWVW